MMRGGAADGAVERSSRSRAPGEHRADLLKIVSGLREQVLLGRIEAGCLLLQERRHTGERRRALELADVAQDRDVRLGSDVLCGSCLRPSSHSFLPRLVRSRVAQASVLAPGVEVRAPSSRERAGQDPGTYGGQSLVSVGQTERVPGRGEDPESGFQMSLVVEVEV